MIGLLAGPVSRIVWRYLIGAFTAYALLTPEVGEQLTGDRDIAFILEMAMGGTMTLAVEGFYIVAKWMGWQT